MKGICLKISEKEIKLRRNWTERLYREHEDIAQGYSVQLAKPIIEIFESGTYWGAWHPDLKTIKISASLIKAHSWDVVLNILKHEMAHQIVTESFGCEDGHGTFFKQACRMLGVPKEFCTATGDIPRTIPSLKELKIGSEKSSMLEKVDKLFSLAGSTNEHEAKLAMEKAQALIQKYNLKRVRNDETAKYVYQIINHKKKRIESHQRMICSILSDFFFVDIIFSYLYDARTCNTHRTIELLGTLENVLTAEYVYFFLVNQLAHLWKNHQAQTAASFRLKRSFWMGIVAGFREKLEKMGKQRVDCDPYPANKQETVSALVRANDRMLTELRQNRFPRLSRRRQQYPKVYKETYDKGKKEGNHLNLHKGISRKDGYRGKLLTLRAS